MSRAQVGAGSGFLFGAPAGTFGIRGGWAAASAKSDVFAFTTQQLTLDRADFSSPALEIDFAFRVRPKTDLVFSSSAAAVGKKSEFRNFVDNDDRPIEQRTVFARVPITVGVKQYLWNRGRSLGRLAWTPARFVPYVGAGAGAMWYRFRQTGDFVDFQTNDIFGTTLESGGWTPTAHALAGAEVTISPRFAFVTESRYLWSRAKPSADFSGFERLDLSGLSMTAGIAVRF